MSTKWTPEQQKVIDLRDRNILVSAAAGSGKTAVLVERILSILTDQKHPVDIDRLLITTFTNAAAMEMKERISQKLEERLAEDSKDKHLQKQLTLIHNAQITTIHGFCLNLVRNHFHAIDLDPGFRIGDEGELQLLRKDTVQELLEECYEEEDEAFAHFVECFAEGKTDAELERHILDVYEYSRSHPEPEKWLESCIVAYQMEKLDSIGDADWMEKVCGQIRLTIADYLDLERTAMTLAEGEGGPAAYLPALEADVAMLEKFLAADGYDMLGEVFLQVQWTALSRKKDPGALPEIRDQVKALRDQVKKGIEALKKQYFFQSTEEMYEDMRLAAPLVETLADLVIRFAEKFRAAKVEKNMVDFGDLEHYALKLLLTEEDGELKPTEIAREYSQHFHEIMIDEYQDINLIQERILSSVSREVDGKHNIFMVGDVKQSIYKFRLSRPELFMEKYERYTQEDSPCQKVELHKNFRSRRQVLSSANFLFYRMMKKEMGNVVYDEQAALYPGASFPQREAKVKVDERSEVLLLNVEKELIKGEDTAKMARELEARMIARKIKQLRREYQVLDKVTGTYREARYSDMVILLRSLTGWADVFAEVLMEEGIPAYTTSRTGYFSTIEIKTILNYLSVMDNPMQDIPLAAVLHSPIGKLDGDQMARIRQTYKEGRFYDSVQLYVQSGEDEVIRGKLTAFLAKLEYLRGIAVYTPIHEVLYEVLEVTGYGDYLAAMPGGAQRKANVEMLIEKAVAYASGSYKGLFHFIRYIQQLQKYQVDFGEASTTGENENTVRIMSIHKSKGLEFPVVFATGMGKQFNMQDSRSRIMLHQESGIGIDAIDPEQRIKMPTLLKKVIQNQIVTESLGEELRVLYVALTRAKEKLILTGAVTDLEKMLEKKAVSGVGAAGLSYHQLTKAVTYLDWLLPVLQSEEAKREFEITAVSIADLLEDSFIESTRAVGQKEVFLDWDTEQVYDAETREKLQKYMSYRYPYEAEEGIRTKVTVTELKKLGQYEEEDMETVLYPEPEIIPLLPSFLNPEEEKSGTTRGNAYHKVMELLDPATPADFASVKRAIEGFAADGKMDADWVEMIYINHIVTFLKNPLAQRMAAAGEAGQLKKEQSFVLGREANQVNERYKSEEMILVQGIIDAYFEEDGELVLVDYKSDKVENAQELVNRYKVQLDSYEAALEQLTGQKVREKLIYSFALGREVRL